MECWKLRMTECHPRVNVTNLTAKISLNSNSLFLKSANILLFPCMAFSGFPSPKFRFHFKENIKLQKECIGLNSETATIKLCFKTRNKMSVSGFILLGLFCFSCKFATAQRDVDMTEQKSLSQIMERDQYIRKSDDSAAYRSMIDSSNLAYVEMLIRNYGLAGEKFCRLSGNYILFG